MRAGDRGRASAVRRLLVLIGTASATAATASTGAMGAADARHLLARAGFGGTPAEISAMAQRSREVAVDELIAAARRPRTSAPDAELVAVDPPPGREASSEERARFVREQNRRTVALRGWWVGEMLATRAPLAERMTLFWHGHFATSQQKVRRVGLVHRQNSLLREHALGDFRSLLHAVARDPAMMIYLDSARNTRQRPNENFAREVMELFTLGEGNYGEADVREAARAFTGWSVDPESGAFIERPAQHDGGEKTFLGRTGAFDGAAVLGILLEQPVTARFIVGKLWREFVSPQPDAAEVERIAGRFRTARYDIAVAVRELLLSEAFWSERNRGTLVKSPVDFLVGTLRQFGTGAAEVSPVAVARALDQLGQNLYAPPNVRGWPGGAAWINAATLLARKQFVDRLLRAEDTIPRAAGSMAPESAGMAEGAQARRAMNAMRIDTEGWLAAARQVNGRAPETLLLAVPTVATLAVPVESRAELRAVLLDAAYQVK